MLRNKKNPHDTLKKVAIGSGVAAAAGYVAGILTAPKSGKQTRGDIKAQAKKSRADAEKEVKKLQIELEKLSKEAKTRGGKLGAKAQKELKVLVEKAKNSKDKTGEAPFEKVMPTTRILSEPSRTLTVLLTTCANIFVSKCSAPRAEVDVYHNK
jgi:gas vesicle protein